MKDVVLDTNFLVIPYTHKIDIYAELEKIVPEQHRLIILKGSITELEKLGKGASATAVGARVGLQILAEKNIEIIESEGNVDDAITGYANTRENVIVATNDRELKKKIKKTRAEIICFRGKAKLARI